MKRIIALISVFLILFTVPCCAVSWSEIQQEGDTFESEGREHTYIEQKDTANLVNGLANILTTIGVIVLLSGFLIIGIKYMTATPDQAAKLKTKLVGLVVSGVIIIGAYGVWITAGKFFNMDEATEYTTSEKIAQNNSNDIELTSIKIIPATKLIRVNESYRITIQKTPANARKNTEIIYTSSNSGVASVDENGSVTGISEGTAVITATAQNGVQSQTTVTVSGRYNPNSNSYEEEEDDYNYTDEYNESKISENVTIAGVSCWCYRPSLEEAGGSLKNLPIVIFLHGDGDGAKRMDGEGLSGRLPMLLKKGEISSKAVVIAPRREVGPDGKKDKIGWGINDYTSTLNNIIDELINNKYLASDIGYISINPSRISLTGHSKGTWHAAAYALNGKYKNNVQRLALMSYQPQNSILGQISCPVKIYQETESGYLNSVVAEGRALSNVKVYKVSKYSSHEKVSYMYRDDNVLDWLVESGSDNEEDEY